MNKDQIIEQMKLTADQFVSACTEIPDDLFFRQPATKWSIAQNVAHLESSAKMTGLAYRLPKIIVRIYAGKPNRSSRTYDELVTKYKLKLEQGGKASGTYIPKPVPSDRGKKNVLSDYQDKMNVLIRAIDKNWEDGQLDNYIAPHPLLGKITLRELGYFTIYHTLHHHNIVQQRLKEKLIQ